MQEMLVAPYGDPQGQRRLHVSPKNKSSPRPMKTCSSPALKVRPLSQPAPASFHQKKVFQLWHCGHCGSNNPSCGGLSRAFLRVSHITSPYILNASSSPLLPPAVTTRNTSRHGQMPQAGDCGKRQSSCLIENHCCKDSLWTEGGPLDLPQACSPSPYILLGLSPQLTPSSGWLG